MLDGEEWRDILTERIAAHYIHLRDVRFGILFLQFWYEKKPVWSEFQVASRRPCLRLYIVFDGA